MNMRLPRLHGFVLILALTAFLIPAAALWAQAPPPTVPQPPQGVATYAVPSRSIPPRPTLNPTQVIEARRLATAIPTPNLAVLTQTVARRKATVAAYFDRITPVSMAVQTRGKRITVASRRVQLPPDAYVERTVDH